MDDLIPIGGSKKKPEKNAFADDLEFDDDFDDDLDFLLGGGSDSGSGKTSKGDDRTSKKKKDKSKKSKDKNSKSSTMKSTTRYPVPADENSTMSTDKKKSNSKSELDLELARALGLDPDEIQEEEEEEDDADILEHLLGSGNKHRPSAVSTTTNPAPKPKPTKEPVSTIAPASLTKTSPPSEEAGTAKSRQSSYSDTHPVATSAPTTTTTANDNNKPSSVYTYAAPTSTTFQLKTGPRPGRRNSKSKVSGSIAKYEKTQADSEVSTSGNPTSPKKTSSPHNSRRLSAPWLKPHSPSSSSQVKEKQSTSPRSSRSRAPAPAPVSVTSLSPAPTTLAPTTLAPTTLTPTTPAPPTPTPPTPAPTTQAPTTPPLTKENQLETQNSQSLHKASTNPPLTIDPDPVYPSLTTESSKIIPPTTSTSSLINHESATAAAEAKVQLAKAEAEAEFKAKLALLQDKHTRALELQTQEWQLQLKASSDAHERQAQEWQAQAQGLKSQLSTFSELEHQHKVLGTLVGQVEATSATLARVQHQLAVKSQLQKDTDTRQADVTSHVLVDLESSCRGYAEASRLECSRLSSVLSKMDFTLASQQNQHVEEKQRLAREHVRLETLAKECAAELAAVREQGRTQQTELLECRHVLDAERLRQDARIHERQRQIEEASRTLNQMRLAWETEAGAQRQALEIAQASLLSRERQVQQAQESLRKEKIQFQLLLSSSSEELLELENTKAKIAEAEATLAKEQQKLVDLASKVERCSATCAEKESQLEQQERMQAQAQVELETRQTQLVQQRQALELATSAWQQERQAIEQARLQLVKDRSGFLAERREAKTQQKKTSHHHHHHRGRYPPPPPHTEYPELDASEVSNQHPPPHYHHHHHHPWGPWNNDGPQDPVIISKTTYDDRETLSDPTNLPPSFRQHLNSWWTTERFQLVGDTTTATTPSSFSSKKQPLVSTGKVFRL